MVKNNGSKQKTVLIIGDWFIDENWLVAKHNTYSSSHTGDVHYISKHKETGRKMISLCGAAEILEVLRLHFEKIKKEDLNFIGIGAWSKKDDNILKCTLCPRHPEKKCLTPFTIKSLQDKVNSEKCPYEKSKCNYNPSITNLSRDEDTTSTNRIIRCYEGYGGGEPHLLYRFDWQLPLPALDYEPLKKICKDKEIIAVIIEDHGQGVITSESISELLKVLSKNKAGLNEMKWYIRTKIDNPKWMSELKEKDITAKLIVNDYRLALHKQGKRRWQCGKKLGRSSLEILGKLTGVEVFRHGQREDNKNALKSQRAAILLDENTAIAKDNEICYNLHKSPGIKQLINIGRTTMFYDALIAQDLINDPREFGEQCRLALQCAFDWSKVQSEEWNKEELNFYNYEKALSRLRKTNGATQPKPAETSQKPELSEVADKQYETALYLELWNEWNASSNKYGIIDLTDFSDNDFENNEDIKNIVKNIKQFTTFEAITEKTCIQTLNELLKMPDFCDMLKGNSEKNPFRQEIVNLVNKTKSDRSSKFSELPFYVQSNLKKLNRMLLNLICKEIPVPQEEFQVWRGEGILEKYISVGGPKRDSINELISKISKFHEKKENKHPFNCLLFASPGWGKSFLAKCLAKHFDMHYLEFSFSQMATTKDLVDCFDTICSIQNRSQKKVLVLMDEVNCRIEGHSAMGLLLSPIWDGSFIREGKTYRLSPAVWIFASTEPINSMIEENKGSDFISRLNGPIIELDSLFTNDPKDAHKLMQSIRNLKEKLIQNPIVDFERDDDYENFDMSDGQFKTEQVYLGVSLLNSLWGPISQIQREVLKLFYYMLPINGFRSMEFFISNFKNIQRGVVLCSNVPSIKDFPELKRHIVMPKKWRENAAQFIDNESLVKIITIVK